MEDKYMKGTPPLCAVSARDYIFKVNDANYIVEIPRKGTYSDVAPDVFEAIDGGFNIYDEESRILYLPSITKVLFAVGKYPKLDVNQLFVPYSIKIGDDIVTLVGQIITMVVSAKDVESSKVSDENNAEEV